MRTLSALVAIALAIVLAFLFAEDSSAAQLTGCLSSKGKITKLALGGTPTSPCRGGETEVSIGSDPEPSFVLLDQNQEEVGTVVDIGTDTVVTLLTLVDSLGRDRNVLLRANRAGFLELFLTSRPYFEVLNCSSSELAWFTDLLPNSGGSEGFDLQGATVVLGESGELVLYVASGDVAEEVELNRFLSGGDCQSTNFVQDMFPAEVLVDNLHFEFSPPFTLVVE